MQLVRLRTMLKTITATLVMLGASSALASHPHQAVCVVSTTQPNGDLIQFVLQIESAREYVSGDPSKDVHDYRYQVRVCDDDNDSPSCSTYESAKITHAPTDEVTLVGMKNKGAVFFSGTFTGSVMEGKIVHRERTGRTLVPFKAKLDQCIAQSWVKLVPESDSRAY